MKTLEPCWNEFFIKEVENGKMVGLTVFHETTLPPDDFVANCSIFFTDLANRGTEQQDFWVCQLIFGHAGSDVYIVMIRSD